jgi:hypothetical protein
VITVVSFINISNKIVKVKLRYKNEHIRQKIGQIVHLPFGKVLDTLANYGGVFH